MRKLIIASAVVSALMSSAAHAEYNNNSPTWQGKTYGQDAISVNQLNAPVETFCKFGATGNGGLTSNVTNATQGGSAAEADGAFTLAIQNSSDDTVKSATGTYKIPNAVCNKAFTMSLKSNNGGLKNPAQGDSNFLQTVEYKADFNFANIATTEKTSGQITSTTQVGSSTMARAGEATITVTVEAQDKLLIAGTYSDILTATISPNA